MQDKKLEKPVIAASLIFFILTVVIAVSLNTVSASGGSIAMTNTYPQEGEAYQVVNHFTYQLTAVNANTTVSVSIDGGPPRPKVLQGISKEVSNGKSTSSDWYTWQLTTPAITQTGKHTVQFFSHYYVWQDTEHYWSEFNSYSSVYSFTITEPISTSSTSTQTHQSIPVTQPIPEFQFWIIQLLFGVAIIAPIAFARRRKPEKAFSQTTFKSSMLLGYGIFLSKPKSLL